MSNKEKFKNLYDSKFNQEKICDDILKQATYKKDVFKLYYKLLFIPCLIIICLISVVLFNNKKSNLKDNEPNMVKKQIPKENILGGGGYYEPSWSFDVFDTKVVFEKADYVVKVKILDIGDSFFEKDNWHFPVTPISVETLEVLKGDKNTEISVFYKHGGYVTIEQIINSHPEDWNTKYELYKFSEEDRKTKYWYYEEPGHYDLEVGKTYVISLSSKNAEGRCYTGANGYDIFDIIDNKYINVLTGNELILD